MKPVVLTLESPQLRAVMTDIAMTQRWEALRRSERPLSVHGLAEICGISDAVAQRTLDELVDAGLAVRLRASAGRRTITYRPIADRVLIEWDAGNESHLGFLLQRRQALRAYSRGVIDRNDTAETRGMPGLPKFRGHQSFTLTCAEAEAIYHALRKAWEAITQVEVEARARAAANGRGTTRPPSLADAVAAETGYHVSIEYRPLKSPELPVADIGTWESQSLAREIAFITSSPAAVLTDREREIAARLAAGESRPKVASALGVTLNTVASATKRIYRKLGVRSRAEFVSRMKDG